MANPRFERRRGTCQAARCIVSSTLGSAVQRWLYEASVSMTVNGEISARARGRKKRAPAAAPAPRRPPSGGWYGHERQEARGGEPRQVELVEQAVELILRHGVVDVRRIAGVR